jgi:thioesterase domain-containing protein
MILAAIEAKSAKNDTSAETVFLNWIGLDHVASLTEVHLHAMFTGANQFHAEATDMVQDPLVFLILLDRHQISYTFGPNFFIAAVLRTLQDIPGASYNLSSLKHLISGGEANVVETSAKAAAAFAKLGAAPNAIKPAFGMTETCAGSIYNSDFPARDQARGHEFGSLGTTHKGMEMRIVDENGDEVPAGTSGSLEVRGPVVFSRYYRNPEATESSFHDGWFITGDNGKIEADGQLDLTGRTKEVLIINGINYTPHEVEATLEDVEGAKPSFTAVFSYRPKGSETESVAVVYAPTYEIGDIDARIATNNAISKGVMEQVGSRPLILPLNDQVLQKTTLGKLSRTKLKKSFEAGAFSVFQQINEQETAIFKQKNYTAPSTPLEEQILDAFASVIDMPVSEIGATEHLFGLGVNSIAVIKIKKRLEEIMGRLIPVSLIITNPNARALADALENISKPKEYNPVIVLQDKGDKTPLWLIHPGVGEVLVFLGLAAHINDRPLYALRARGFEKGEAYFKDTKDAITTYHEHIKRIQPKGPYAIGGYSFGSMYAFEITKILNANGDEVKMLAALNLPPHIKHRMRQLDWTACLLHLSYFLDFFPEAEAHAVHPELAKHDREYCLDWVVNRAPKERMDELALDKEALTNWADLAFALQYSAVDYEPSGLVDGIDVFCAIPLAAVVSFICHELHM